MRQSYINQLKMYRTIKRHRAFNENLHLCCLITYGMLLRPHREIRCLTFSDFNEDYTMVALSGKRVKSKQNRVVPVPDYIRQLILCKSQILQQRRC